MVKTLNTLVRLRRFAVDGAKQALAASLHAETKAADAEKAAEETLRREYEAAATLGADDAAVEAFEAWLPAGRKLLGAAQQRNEDARAETAVARAKLSTAMTAVEVVDRLRQSRLAEQQIVTDRAAQATLDEIGQTHRRIK